MNLDSGCGFLNPQSPLRPATTMAILGNVFACGQVGEPIVSVVRSHEQEIC